MQHTQNPELPARPLLALAGCWRLQQGEHPSLVGPLAEILATLPLFPTAEQWQELAPLGLPIMLAHNGHHMLYDEGPAGAMAFPLAPVFVRDLCGRVIHTGLLPLPTPPETPTFPATCADVPATMGGAEYIEQALFTSTLLLEPTTGNGNLSASLPNHGLQGGYAQPGRYPYKIRPQTFYADGWRLPQLNRVFARRAAGADDIAAQLMQQWAARPEGQDYETFYEAMGGSAKVDALFLQGVTLIPTLEGYNGAFQVDEHFHVQGVEAGRAVEGLHKVMGQEESPLPYGTILKVLRPGYVTATQVEPAEVIISNGPSLTPPDALLPNLALPHPHTSPQWGKCWLPTKPQHFAAPALWDWLPDGRFVQTEGPLWCPTHYVYASTSTMVQAFRKPLEDCPTLYTLPAKLKDTFAPAIPCTRYDTLNERTRTERMALGNRTASPLYASALDALPLAEEVAPLGYHALPRSWPTLRQSAHLPEHTKPEPCPAALAERLAPVASPRQTLASTQARDDSARHVITSEPLRALLAACEAHEDAPLPDWLPALPNSQLQLNVKRLFASRTYRTALTMANGKLPEALFRFKESALAWRRLRYRLVAKYPAAWLEAEKQGMPLTAAEGLANVLPETAHNEARSRLLAQSTLTKVPAPAANPLHNAPNTRKLKAHQPRP